MNIDKNTVVTVDYVLDNLRANGRRLPPEKQRMVYLHGDYAGTLPRLEEALQGLAVGAEIELQLAPADHFGEYKPELQRQESLALMPKDVKVGVVLEGHHPVSGQVVLFHVTAIDGDTVTLDGNHPFAGQTLDFRGKVVDVRPATAEEIAHGHVHGEGGHHH